MSDTEPQRERVGLSTLFNPTPRQLDFINAVKTHTFTLYGGSAGAGKSYILRWTLLYLLLSWAKQGHTGVRVGLFSADYPTLNDRQLSKIRVEFPAWLGKFHETDKEFTLAPEYGSGVIAFRNLDNVAKYKSSEFAAVALEEATESDIDTFNLLRFRLRWTGIEGVKFLLATNPGGIGHNWCKRYFINSDYPDELADRADEFKFVRALPADNPHLSKQYLKELGSLPPALRRAYLEGDWDVFAGQIFSQWRRDIHVVEPFEIPHWWRRWGGNDPGNSDPATWYWLAASETGEVYVYREATFTQTPYSEQARQVKALMTHVDAVTDTLFTERLDYWVTGMDAFVKHGETGKGPVDYYQDGGLSGFKQPDHGAGCRGRRAGVMHEYLRVFPGADGKPTAKLKIFSNCRRLIETLPDLPTDPNQPEAVKECSIDHWFDGCFIPGTLIRMGDGTDKAIETIVAGEMVETRNGPRKVLASFLSWPSAPVFTLITVEGDAVTGTADHPVYVNTGEWKRLDSLECGDILLTLDGMQCVREVVSDGESPVYNLTVEDTPEYFANGILVHNCSYPLQSWHIEKSGVPAKPLYQPGSAGDILKHADTLNPRRAKGPFEFSAKG